jgi:hypothetical protein
MGLRKALTKGCHQDARRSSRGLAEVSLATPKMQAVQASKFVERTWHHICPCFCDLRCMHVCVYYCNTYYKAVRVGGGG